MDDSRENPQPAPTPDTPATPAVVRRFTPPNTFRTKVPPTGGISLEQMQVAATEALTTLESESTDWMQADVEKLAGELAAAMRDAAEAPKHVHEINKITHDLKSMAAQFSYPMIGQVGTSLCGFINEDPDRAAARLDVIRVHVDAVVVILANGLAGDGGPAGEHLLSALHKAVDKARRQHAEAGTAAG
jgi:outer membrane murein-binding lipoprotein Lpp